MIIRNNNILQTVGYNLAECLSYDQKLEFSFQPKIKLHEWLPLKSNQTLRTEQKFTILGGKNSE